MSHHAGNCQAEPGAAAQNLPDAAHEKQRQGKSEAHAGTVQSGGQHVILRGKHFCPSQDNTVYGDQLQKSAQAGVQRRHKTMHQELNDCNERGNDDNITRELYLLRNHLSQQRNNNVGTDEYEHRGQSHADAVKCRSGDSQRGAHAQQSHQRGVFPDNSLGQFFSVIHAIPS